MATLLDRRAVHPTLRDPEAQAHFERDGIVILPLLSRAEAAGLRDRVVAALPHDPGAFFDLFRNNPPELRRQIDALVRAELEERAAEVFVDHDFWSATVLVKPPGPAGEIGLHTDWNMVDEDRYRSGLIWVALSDVHAEDGGLAVVPGTNRLDVPYRGNGVHYDFDEPEVRARIDARTVPVAVPAGHAAIWDNRVLHGSGPNRTGEWRIAAALGFKPRAASLYHYRPTPEGQARRYRIEREFFLEYQPFDPATQPGGPHVLAAEDVESEPWALTPEALDSLGSPEPIHGNPLPLPRTATPAAAAGPAASEPAAPRGRWWRRRAAPAPAPAPPTAPLRWLDLTPTELGEHPGLLEDIAARRLDGTTVRGVFSPEECARAVAHLDEDRRARQPAMFGEMLGISLANLGQHVPDPHDRTAYLDDAALVAEILGAAFATDPFARIGEVLAPASGGRPVRPAEERGRPYLPGNVRWMAPGGRALPAHVGNEFQQQRDGSTDHLRSTTRILDHYSWFVVLQAPDHGGELAVFDRLYETHQAGQSWGESGRDDAEFDDVPAKLIAPEPGQLVLFGGGWRWHRVNPIVGSRPRITYGGFAGPSVDGREIHSWF